MIKYICINKLVSSEGYIFNNVGDIFCREEYLLPNMYICRYANGIYYRKSIRVDKFYITLAEFREKRIDSILNEGRN